MIRFEHQTDLFRMSSIVTIKKIQNTYNLSGTGGSVNERKKRNEKQNAKFIQESRGIQQNRKC